MWGHLDGAGCVGELRLAWTDTCPPPPGWIGSDTERAGQGWLLAPPTTGSAPPLGCGCADSAQASRGSGPLRGFVPTRSEAPAGPSVPAADPVEKDAGWWLPLQKHLGGAVPVAGLGEPAASRPGETPAGDGRAGRPAPQGPPHRAGRAEAAAPTPQEKGEPRRLSAWRQ